MKIAPSLPDAVDVGRFPDHQAAVVDARLHPADVVAHDEEDVGLGCVARMPAGSPSSWRQQCQQTEPDDSGRHAHGPFLPWPESGRQPALEHFLGLLSPSCAGVHDRGAPTLRHVTLVSRLFAGVVIRCLNCLQYAIQVVGLRRLQGWEGLVRHEFLFPQQLTDGQHVPVVHIGADRAG